MIPLAKNIKRFFSFREIAIFLIAVIVSVSAGLGVFVYLKKDVIINDNGSQLVVKTMKNTVGEALEQNNISVSPDDYISVSQNTELQRMKVNKIAIKRAVPVNILSDGTEFKLMTYRNTVGEALAVSPVKPEGLDRLEGVSPGDRIVKEMSIRIIRVKEDIISEKEPIPYQTLKRENSRLDKGTEKVVKQGEEGVREKQYKVVTEDGVQTLRELVKDSVLLDPINMIIEFGTVLNHKTARGGIIRYRKVLDMRATAYTASFQDTGKNPGDPGFGITKTGIRAKKGVIAVDPRVIPLGTRVYVEVAGSTPDYGFALAADTGGAIKKDLIDLYFEGQDFVNRWGVKRVKVYILLDE
ncbi:MAG: DUF348 domain-containing protein [Ruminiclostridium sp.]|nr:DUF348 domain-containing protein [Ruminiclostridium sp.]